MQRADRSSWKNQALPEKHAALTLDIRLTQEELEKLKCGSIPEAMEDHWFLFYEDGKFYCVRSWSGNCIFAADVPDSGIITHALVSRDPAQYRCDNDEEDCAMLTHLILSCAGRTEEAGAALHRAIRLSALRHGKKEH